MSAPYGYPNQQGYPPQDQYAQSPGEAYVEGQGYENTTSPPPGGPPQGDVGGKKKKRGYASQAYDFGAGSNSQLGGQPVAGGAYPQPQTAAYGGYPQQQQADGMQPGLVSPNPFTQHQGQPQPMYGQPPPGVGGYQPPDAGYPGPAAGGVAGITGGMAQMAFGGAPQAQAQAPAGAVAGGARSAMNPLHPSDLTSQLFNVQELDYPPPPINLPPNVSDYLLFCLRFRPLTLTLDYSQASHPPQTPIVLLNTFARHLMRSLRQTHC